MKIRNLQKRGDTDIEAFFQVLLDTTGIGASILITYMYLPTLRVPSILRLIASLLTNEEQYYALFCVY